MPTDLCFAPSEKAVATSNMSAFIQYMADRNGLRFRSYQEFECFTTQHYTAFWDACLHWFNLPVSGNHHPVCTSDLCEEASFFPAVKLNYAECLLAGVAPQDVAVTHFYEDGDAMSITGAELCRCVAALASHLRDTGIRPGDRVAALARNTPELIVAALATAAVGAIFAVCSADMPLFAVLERLAPIEPSALFTVSQQKSWEVGADLPAKVGSLLQGLDGLRSMVVLDDGDPPRPVRHGVRLFRYHDIVSGAASAAPAFERFPFNHPLSILFSSGTTGRPKAIVHGAGGTLLEHCKEHRLHCDLRPCDRLFYQTSCAWMMWNWQLSALASGVEIVTYDGPVLEPEVIWRLIGQHRVSTYGTSAAYLQYCASRQCSPKALADLSALRSLLSTGSVLWDHQFDWITAQVKSLPVQSISGGTEVMGCLVLGNPNLPVCRGEIQCRSLGLDVRLIPLDGVAGNVGELVCANPFPSRPLGFWGDEDGTRFHEAYFSQHPAIWTHGDIAEFTASGGVRIHGRSDGIIKIGGVRIGPAEISSILAQLPEIEDVLPVTYEDSTALGGARLVMLILLRAGLAAADMPTAQIRKALLLKGGSHMVPFRLFAVTAFPRTFNGKISHLAAREAVNGRSPRNQHALINPESIGHIREVTRSLRDT